MVKNEFERPDGSAVLIPLQSSCLSAVPSARGTVPQDTKPFWDSPKAKQPAVLEEVLIEEVSIDGMCGVY